MCNGNEPFLKQRGVKSQKATIPVFAAVKNLQGTIREEEDGPEYVVFNLYSCKILFLNTLFSNNLC